MAQHFNFDEDGDDLDKFAKGPTFTLGGEEFECWAEVPASAMQAMRVIEFGGAEVPVMDVVAGIEKLLVTRRWQPHDAVDGEEGPQGEWVDADDVQRFRALIHGNEKFVKASKIVKIYQALSAEMGKGLTAQSRR